MSTDEVKVAQKSKKKIDYQFFQHDTAHSINELGKARLLDTLRQMLLIRNFETRAESAYQHGSVGGFFHSYIGQEAIQTAAVQAFGLDNWWVGTYRCHALALTLGATPDEIMAELYGRSTGNAMGRGGSMHLYTERLLGGFGIVGGQVPIATGAAFSIKYQKIKDKIAICFLGDGAVAQGAFHESLNLASLFNLPCVYIIENNKWGMGTAVERAISAEKLAEQFAPAYGMKSYTLDGMDFFNCYGAFKKIKEDILETSRPVLVEIIAERFRGHSISDPGLYRSKDELKECLNRDPIHLFRDLLEKHRIIDEDTYTRLDKEQREIVIRSMKFAEESPWPDVMTLGEDVFAP